MKKLNILLITLAALISFSSCENNDDDITIAPEIIPPVLNELTPENFVVTKESLYNKVSYWSWKAPDYGFEASVEYTIEADTIATFKEPAVVGTVKATTMAITAEMLNKAALNFTTKEEPITLFVRLKAVVASDEFGAYAPEVYSNTQIIRLTPVLLYPTKLYMIGADFGNWDWGSDDIADLIPVNGLDGAFWCTRYFKAANGFKWAPAKAWGEDFFELAEKIGYTTNDGNAFVPKDGLYTVYIDYLAGQIAIEEAKIYGMGDCFGGWDAGNYPFTNSGTTTSITTANAGELRIYAGVPEGIKTTSDWWTREFIILDGKIAYRGTGGDQDRVQVPAGKIVTLDFNAGTGTIK